MIHLLGKIPPYLYLAGLVGATATYVFYPSTSSKTKTKKAALNGYPKGLINYKNECFMNVILQSLAASHKVTEWLMRSTSLLNTTPSALTSSSSSSSSFSLLKTLAATVASINRLTLNSPAEHDTGSGSSDATFDKDQNEIYAAHLIKRALNSHNWCIESEEHDCHEFFHLLMDVLDEEQQANKMSLSSLNYFHPSHLRDVSRTVSRSPFHGYLATQLQCLDCNYKYPLKLESFYVLSLTLPQVRPATSQHDFLSAMGSVNLYECLNNYFKPELITEMKCESCCCAEADSNGDKKPLESSTSGNKKLKSKGFIKRQAIAKLPDTLCIQIQRNSWSDQANEMVKKTNHVKFPLSIKIDNVAPGVINAQRFSNAAMSSFSSSSFSLRQVGIGALLGGNKQLTSSRSAGNVSTSSPGGVASPNMIQSYELRSAIVHYGSAHSGHFVAYRKPLGSSSAATDDWLQISDSDIKKVKQSTLLNSNVYMLFYDKVANMVLASPDL